MTRWYKQEGRSGNFQIMLPYISFGKPMLEFLPVNYGEGHLFYKKNYIIGFLDEDKMDAISDAFFAVCKPGVPTKWWKTWEARFTDLTRQSLAVENADLSKYSAEKLKQTFDNLLKADIDMWAAAIFIDALDNGADMKRIKEIAKEYDLDAHETQVLLTPLEPTYIADWESAVTKYQNGKLSFSELHDKFFWYRTDYALFDILTQDFADSFKVAHTPFKSPKTAQEKILSQKKLTKNPLALFQKLAIWRDERKKANFIGLHGLIKILREQFSRQKLPLELINDMKYSQTQQLFAGKLDKETLLTQSKEGIINQYTKDEIMVETTDAKKFTTLLNQFQNLKATESLTSFKGSIACKGFVKGIAKVITDVHPERHEFLKGQILVTAMTRPEYVPLMKKAAAVVTDEGGISCHAAIVSRELNIPCIIGTKIATKVIKSGDLIEVDANTGVVRKL